ASSTSSTSPTRSRTSSSTLRRIWFSRSNSRLVGSAISCPPWSEREKATKLAHSEYHSLRSSLRMQTASCDEIAHTSARSTQEVCGFLEAHEAVLQGPEVRTTSVHVRNEEPFRRLPIVTTHLHERSKLGSRKAVTGHAES